MQRLDADVFVSQHHLNVSNDRFHAAEEECKRLNDVISTLRLRQDAELQAAQLHYFSDSSIPYLIHGH